jgi:HK97 family phage major capsid protein
VDIREHVVALNARIININEQQKAYIEESHKRHPGEPFTAEENETLARQDKEIEALQAERDQFVAREQREKESGIAREAFDATFGTGAANLERQASERTLRDWFTGKDKSTPELDVDLSRAMEEKRLIRAGADEKELRSILGDGGASGGSLVVPTTMQRSLYEYLEASIAALRMPTTKINTSSGEALVFPRVGTHGIATQVIAQGTAIGGTDPIFANMTLNAYKYGQLTQVSSEMVTDSAFDIIGFVTRNVARATGRLINADLVVGTGSGEPNGMMTATTQTANTGGSLINPTYESLIDLQHAVVDEYRGPDAAWLLRDATMAVIRKIRDGAGGTEGAPIWQPSITMGITAGAPDILLGFPVYTDPNVASIASNAAVIAYGDWSAYYFRSAGNFTFERSDDYAFNTDLVSFRGKWRVDGDLIDTLATAKQRVNV